MKKYSEIFKNWIAKGDESDLVSEGEMELAQDFCYYLEELEEESEEQNEYIYNMASCMLSILDCLKLFDKNQLYTEDETLSEMMFRKMKAYNIDLNKELGFNHLKPVKKQ